MYMTLEPPSPDTSGKQQEGVGEVKKGKRKKIERVREQNMEMGRKKERKENKSFVQLRSIIVRISLYCWWPESQLLI